MELPQPNPADPAILALGPRDRDYEDVRALCQNAGIRIDRADSTSGALRIFLECGGHDAVLISGAMRDGECQEALVATLRRIDGDLELWDLAGLRRRLGV